MTNETPTCARLDGMIRKYETRLAKLKDSSSPFANGSGVQCRDIVDDLHELQAALAALPGGGVDEAMVTRAEDYYYDNAPFNGPSELREGLRGCLTAALSPTPHPHEADRNA